MCDTLTKQPKRKKQCFSEAWLIDDRFKSWIRKVSSDDSLFHCGICNKTLTCGSHVLRHANSARHKNNTKRDMSINNDDVRPKTKKRRFLEKWLDIDLFKPWLCKAPNDENLAFCTFCDVSISVAIGVSQLYRHTKCKKHIMMSKKHVTETTSIEDENNEPPSPFEERRKLVEIRYAALIGNTDISRQTAKQILCLFQEIGKDFNVLNNMRMDHIKVANVIPDGTDRAVNSLQKNTECSIFTDKTSDSDK